MIFEQRAITHEKGGQPCRKSNLICNSSYGSLLPTFIQICESIAKKSPENECDGQTDRQTDRQTDKRRDGRVQTYSPLRFHRWETNNSWTLMNQMKHMLTQTVILPQGQIHIDDRPKWNTKHAYISISVNFTLIVLYQWYSASRLIE